MPLPKIYHYCIADTIFEFSYCQNKLVMSQNLRKRQNAIDGVMETLNRESLCAIPSDLLRLLMQERTRLLEKSNETNENISKFCEATTNQMANIADTLEVIAVNMSSIGEKNENSNAELLTKLDNLTNAVAATNLASSNRSGVPDAGKNKLLQKRFTLIQKIHRDERLCKIYAEGIGNGELKFAPLKFRTHISSTASENEKKHRRAETIFKVQSQINIMQDFVAEWKKRIQEIDTEIDVLIGANEHLKESIKEKIRTQEETARAKVEKESITKLISSYGEEKKSGNTEFLLTTKKNNPTNYQGSRRGGGRGRWRPTDDFT